MTNASGYPDTITKETFYESVVKLCARSDGVWDFYSARKPFMNILRISPSVASNIFEERIDHIVGILRWSSPSEIGKCWATWEEFREKVDWLSEEDIDEIVDELGPSGRFPFRKSDRPWLEELKRSKSCTETQKQKINDYIKK